MSWFLWGFKEVSVCGVESAGLGRVVEEYDRRCWGEVGND